MPKPASFIALSMSIDQSKWYLAYSIMLIHFKIVILSVTLLQSITTYKLLLFRWLYQKVTLCLFLTKQNWIADNQFTIVRCRSSCSTSISVFGWCIAEVRSGHRQYTCTLLGYMSMSLLYVFRLFHPIFAASIFICLWTKINLRRNGRRLLPPTMGQGSTSPTGVRISLQWRRSRRSWPTRRTRLSRASACWPLRMTVTDDGWQLGNPRAYRPRSTHERFFSIIRHPSNINISELW